MLILGRLVEVKLQQVALEEERARKNKKTALLK